MGRFQGWMRMKVRKFSSERGGYLFVSYFLVDLVVILKMKFFIFAQYLPAVYSGLFYDSRKFRP